MSTTGPASPPAAGPAPLVAFEGIDGSGTTTQAKLLRDWLAARGIAAHLTAEPSTGAIGAMIRRLLRGESAFGRAPLALLFAADRLDHLTSEILPRLHAGEVVITDRYVYSSLAYQSLDLDPGWVAELNALAPEPDLIVYLRIDPRAALRRVASRGGPLEIFETPEQQDRVSSSYDRLLAAPRGSTADPPRILRDPNGSPRIRALDPRGSETAWNVTVIDGGRDLQFVHNAVVSAYSALFIENT